MALRLVASTLLVQAAFVSTVRHVQSWPVQSRSNAASCRQACTRLSQELGSAVHLGGDDPNFSIWDAKQQEAGPACRVKPTTATQVSRIVEILVDDWCRFAIKGGSHSTHLDTSNSVGGVTIDLHMMDHVEISEDRTWANLVLRPHEMRPPTNSSSQQRSHVQGRNRGNHQSTKAIPGDSQGNHCQAPDNSQK